MTTLLVLEPSAGDPLGPLGTWLGDAGAELRVVRPHAGDVVPGDLSGLDGVVCLGREGGAADDVTRPWLASVRAALADAVARRVPVLSLGLGAQLLALACGGSVRAMPPGPEAGVRLVAKRDAAAADPLLADLPFTPDVVQFHSEEVARLPAGSTLLAVSPHCTNQAFRVGPSAWGLQFHVETTPQRLWSWMDEEPAVAALVPRSQHRDAPRSAALLAQAHADLAETWEPVARRFVALCERPPVERLNLLATDGRA